MKVEFQHQGWFEVVVPGRHGLRSDVDKWMDRCLKGDWTVDWMHGEDRSASEAERNSTLYLVERDDDAALARLFWC